MNPKRDTVRVIAFMSTAAAALTVIVILFLCWPQLCWPRLCWPQLFWPPWELEFLGEADFDGQPIPPPGPVTTGGQATYIGVMTFTNINRDRVVELLPSGFQLAPRKTTRTPNVHPVILLFGDQTDGASVFPVGPPQPSGVHYSEMILAVPFVQKTGGSGWHTYIIRMYLDNAGAVVAGEAFGYQKEPAWIEWTGDYARIWKSSLLGDQDLLEGNFSWGAQWYDGNDALTTIPNFQDMVNIMTTRLLGRTGGNSICSHFEWNLDQAKVARAETSYTMKTPFRSGMSAWPGLSPFENVKDGAVVVRGMRWSLATLPPPIIPC
jgi:hypothetical protein